MGEQININGIVYYRLYVPDPVAKERNIPSVVDFWQHDECCGDIYIGSNAHLYCSGCGREIPVINARWKSPTVYNVEDNYISFDNNGFLPCVTTLFGALARMVNTTGLKWFQKLICSINAMEFAIPVPMQK